MRIINNIMDTQIEKDHSFTSQVFTGLKKYNPFRVTDMVRAQV